LPIIDGKKAGIAGILEKWNNGIMGDEPEY
jgi:hypothetical protein